MFTLLYFTILVLVFYSSIRRSAVGESNERACQFVLDMIRCWDWYGSDECILDRDEICQIISFIHSFI